MINVINHRSVNIYGPFSADGTPVIGINTSNPAVAYLYTANYTLATLDSLFI